jgi:hypothetical protein
MAYTCWIIDKHGKRTAVQIAETFVQDVFLETADSIELCFTSKDEQIVLIGHAVCLGNDEVGADRLAEKITDIEVQRLAGGVILINPAQAPSLYVQTTRNSAEKDWKRALEKFFGCKMPPSVDFSLTVPMLYEMKQHWIECIKHLPNAE